MGRQTITSAETSLKQVAGIVRLVARSFGWSAGSRCLDMGGGKYDLTTARLASYGVQSFVLDPYNRTPEHNEQIRAALTAEPADVCICANVLNVVRERDARREIHTTIKQLVRPGGHVFFTVHEGDRSGQGRATPRGWQWNCATQGYLRELAEEYASVQRRGKLICCAGWL